MPRRPTRQLPEARFWWEVMPALPEGPDAQEYHALRRLWGDHTMNSEAKGRGYYRWGTEDNLTPSLFQLWAIFEDRSVLASLAKEVGLPVRGLRSARWAFACEERVERGAFPGVGGSFVIPDIVLHLEDERGEAAVVFEAKRPGTAPTEKDALKLGAYRRLPSLRRAGRVAGSFLVGAGEAGSAAALAPEGATVLTWERVRELLLEGVAAQGERLGAPDLVAAWVDRAFARYGIGTATAPASLAARGTGYGTAEAYQAVDALGLPPRVARFLKGSEAVETFVLGLPAEPPLAWLRGAPSRVELSARKHQQTPDRQLNRWTPLWQPQMERAVP